MLVAWCWHGSACPSYRVFQKWERHTWGRVLSLTTIQTIHFIRSCLKRLKLYLILAENRSFPAHSLQQAINIRLTRIRDMRFIESCWRPHALGRWINGSPISEFRLLYILHCEKGAKRREENCLYFDVRLQIVNVLFLQDCDMTLMMRYTLFQFLSRILLSSLSW